MSESGIDLLFVEPQSYDHHGLPVVSVDGEDFAVADNEEVAHAAAIAAARDSLWAFNVSFLRRFLDLNDRQFKAASHKTTFLLWTPGGFAPGGPGFS